MLQSMGLQRVGHGWGMTELTGLIEVESRMVVARCWREGETGSG